MVKGGCADLKIATQEMTRTAFFTALICSAAFILRWGAGEVMVPLSIQPFMILLSGAILGSRLGALSVILYVLIGLGGIPVFAQPPFGGLTYFLHPTCGFLFGFMGAAFGVGRIVEKFTVPTLGKFFGAMLVGIIIYNLIGIPYLYGIIKFYCGQTITWGGVVQIGLLPFILLDLGKGGVAAVIAYNVTRRVKG